MRPIVSEPARQSKVENGLGDSSNVTFPLKFPSHDRAALSVAVIAVGIGLAFRAFVIALPAETLTARYLADDYFYYLGVASNIASGHGSSFDGGLTVTNGYQPLFLWLLVGGFLLGATKLAAIHLGLAIQALAAAGAALLLYALLARRRAPWAGAGACGLLSLNLFFVLFTLTGFEMALALAAMLLAIVAWESGRPLWIVGVLCGVSILARVDTIVVPAVFSLLLAGSRRFRELAQLLGGLVAIAGPYVLWNVLSFGHPLPDSGVVKAHYRGLAAVWQATVTAIATLPRVVVPGRVVDWGLEHAPVVVWLAAMSMLAVSIGVGIRRENRVLAAIALALALPYLALIDGHETGALVRYLFPVFAIVALFIANSLPPLVLALLVAVHAADVAVYARWDRTTPAVASYVGAAHTLAPQAIARSVAGAPIGSFDAGALGYFSPAPVVNLDGLANHEIVRLRRHCTAPYRQCLRDYLDEKGIAVLAGGTAFGWTGVFDDWSSWERVYESPPLRDGSRLVLVRVPPHPHTREPHTP